MNQKRPPSAKKFIRKQKSDAGDTKRGLKVRKPGSQSSSVKDTKTGGLKIKGTSNQTGALKIKKAGQDSRPASSKTSGLKIKSASNQTGALKIKKAGQDSQVPGNKTTGLRIKSASNQTNATGLSIKNGKTASHILRRKKSGNDTATPEGLNVKRPGGKTQGVGLKVSGRKDKGQLEKIQASVLNNNETTPEAQKFQLKASGNNTLNEQAFHAHTPSNGLFGNIKAAVKKEETPAKPLKKAAPVLDPLLSTPDAQATTQETPATTPVAPTTTPVSPAPATSTPSNYNDYQDSQGTAFCLIPAGNYVVGTDNRPHEVTIPFGIGKFQITKEQFFHYLNETGQSLPEEELNQINAIAPYATCPIVNVSWNDAKNYCRWLRKVTGEYYNLPTSYEWEAAARGTYGLHYPWGEQAPSLEIALFNDGVNEPLSCSSVDYYAHNKSPYGVVGMVGNAMEWTNDSFDDERDPHILKGGSWRSPIDFCNTHSSVVSYPPSRREDYFGFRIIHVPAEYFKDYYIANMT
ncbi:SUMF1/EgtB/PvdO family nonheme iron enzyme [Lentisphaera marina]|uniref:formylglycine-generating enzyme family protein n=1 Tax=Lentisphaera marina TaxID=1111041 RepID=UPI00236556C1|nr:SUMF1/EgtB/PvdO family nonheme iron enzyme [Lentisphaera marina]MDD7986237.1 SUMF1/EgtB/PvdO family nonheme iron enzyme [Lentisphaera marina]